MLLYNSGSMSGVESISPSRFNNRHRVLRLKVCLRQTVTSNQYVAWEESMTDAAEKARAVEIRRIVADDNRFGCLKELVSFVKPVYKLLRLVDGFTPAAGKMYYKAMKIDLDMKEIAEAEGEDSWQAHLYRSWVSDWGIFTATFTPLGTVLIQNVTT